VSSRANLHTEQLAELQAGSAIDRGSCTVTSSALQCQRCIRPLHQLIGCIVLAGLLAIINSSSSVVPVQGRV
jgi:hypothetical protein